MVKEDENEYDCTTVVVVDKHAVVAGLTLTQPAVIDNPESLNEEAGWKFSGLGSLLSVPGFKYAAGGLVLAAGALFLISRRRNNIVRTAA